MTTVADALNALRPGARWIVKNDSYAGVTWLDLVQTKPAEQEVLNKIAELDAALAANAARLAALEADSGFITLLSQVKTASVSQIDTWLQNNVTTLAQARSVLAAIIKLLATRI